MYVIAFRHIEESGADSWEIYRKREEGRPPFTWDSEDKATATMKCTFYNRWVKGNAKVFPIDETVNEEIFF